MIPLREQDLIRQRFAQDLKGPVKLDLFTVRPLPVYVPGRQECPTCPDMEQVLTEIARLSERIDLRVFELGKQRDLEERYGVTVAPTTVVRGSVNRPVLFVGLPARLLFPVLIETIVDVSGTPPVPPPAIRRRLNRLKRTVRVRLFVLPDAPYCAEMARVVEVLALASPHLRAEIIEAGEFPTLTERYAVRAVPATVVEDRPPLFGMLSPEELIEEAVHAAERRAIAPRSAVFAIPPTATPLPPRTEPGEPGQVRPSGLIIPNR